MKKCPRCAMEIQDGDEFCTKCGEKLEAENVQPAEEVRLGKAEEAVPEEPEPAEEINASADVTPVEHSPVVLEAELERKPGNGKKVGIIAGAIAAVAVIGAAAMIAVISGPAKDPKEVVIDAFKSVYTDDTVRPIEEIFGFKGMTEISSTQNMESSMSLKLESSSDSTVDEFSGSGFEIIGKSDVQNKNFFSTFGVQYQGMDLAHADIYLDQKNIMVTVPELSKKIFSLNYAEDLDDQIEASPYLGDYFKYSDVDVNVITEYMDYIMSFYSEEGEVPFDILALWERYKTGSKAIEEFKAAMTVEKGEKASHTVDGASQKCQGYNVTITKDAAITYLRTSADFFLEDETLKKDVLEYLTQVIQISKGMGGYSVYGTDPGEMQDEAWEMAEDSIDSFLTELEDVMGDVTMTVYVGKDGRLAALNAVTELDIDGDLVNVDLNAALKGGAYLTQNAELTLRLYDDEQEVGFTMVKEGTYDGKVLTCDFSMGMNNDGDKYGATYSGTYAVESGEYSMEFAFSGEGDEGRIVMDGVVTNLEKGKSMEITADTIELIVDDESLVKLSGNYGFRPLEGEVSALEGDVMDIFAATEEEWETVQMEAMTNIFSIYGKLQ
ncbi:zinc ribbon domain-containing protein [Lacrimispora sp.]|uniref:zinc ribbon domain-containing protein n=1 Tax=Lacrimispora sp. TaxID=2719234 RepID=UPI0028A21BFA|nr:zinc ribbon domain-containing protein [Lacrimispora sp.]